MARTRRKKKRTHVETAQDEAKKKEPKSFVVRRGKYASILGELEHDLRKVMLPNTAANLKDSRRNVLKDFVQVAGPLGVTHFMILTATDKASYLKIAKTPRGPTVTMKIHGYSLMKDVVASQSRPRMPPTAFQTAPLVILNNVKGAEHLQLTSTMLQNMFPAINVNNINLKNCQRVVLVHYDKSSNRLSFRHYSIYMTPSGIRKNIKTLLQHKEIPDLGHLQDVAEFITKSGYGSESEGEDDSKVELAQDMGRGNEAKRQSRVHLSEMGPRLELEIVKVEAGLCDGEVLYHAHVKKTAAEVQAMKDKKSERERLRTERRQQQEQNVKRKRLEAARKAALAATETARKEGKIPSDQKMWWEEELENARESDGDDDRDYFKQEVGEDPDEDDMIGQASGRQGFKKQKFGKSKGAAGPGGKDMTDDYDDGGAEANGAADGGHKAQKRGPKHGSKDRDTVDEGRDEGRQFGKKGGKFKGRTKGGGHAASERQSKKSDVASGFKGLKAKGGIQKKKKVAK